MENTVFYLSTCDTCKRVLNTLDFLQDFKHQEIKENPLTAKQVEALKSLSGSYEALFSKRAQLYRKRGLKDKDLGEEDFKNLLLEDYTFLKRPTIVLNNTVFSGGSKKVIQQLREEYKVSGE